MKQCSQKKLVLTKLCQDELKSLKAGHKHGHHGNHGNHGNNNDENDTEVIIVYIFCPGDSAKYT